MKKLDTLALSLLRIKSESFKMTLLLLPPIYGLWLYAIGKTTIQGQKFFSLLISVLAFISALFLTYLTLGVPILMAMKSKLFDPRSEVILIPGILIWCFTALSLAHATLKYDLQRQSKKNRRLTFGDYFLRFFVICNWWAGIWAYQKIVNTYTLDE